MGHGNCAALRLPRWRVYLSYALQFLFGPIRLQMRIAVARRIRILLNVLLSVGRFAFYQCRNETESLPRYIGKPRACVAHIRL